MMSDENKPTDGMFPNILNDSEETVKSLSSVPSVIPPTDVYSSYIFATSNRKLSKYGERLLMEVISVAQEYTIDIALGIKKLQFSEKYSEKFAIVDIPVKNLLNSDDKTNYSKAKVAAMELMQIYHTVESPVLAPDGTQSRYSDGTPQYKFATYHLLDRVTINEKPGIVSVKLGEDTWSQILDMGKGYTRYNLLTAKTLDDVVAIRLFQLMSNTKEPLRFSLDRLKGILGLQDKYVQNPTGFINRVIVPAEEEIREKCPFQVVHDLEYESIQKRGRPSISSIVFRKVVPQQGSDPSAVLGPELLNVLVKKFGFDERGIRANLSLFQQAIENGTDILGYLTSIADRISKAANPPGYIVKSLQNLLSDGSKPSEGMKVSFEKRSVDKDGDSGRKKSRAVSNISRTSGRLRVNDAGAFAASNGDGLEEL